MNLSTWSYASPKPRKRGTSLEMGALFPLSFVGFLELYVGARSFSINATRVWMDCNATVSSAFGGAEVVWSGVGFVSIRGGVKGRHVCA